MWALSSDTGLAGNAVLRHDTVDVLDIHRGLGLQQKRQQLHGACQSGMVQRWEAVGQRQKERERRKGRWGQGGARRGRDKEMRWVINHTDDSAAGGKFSKLQNETVPCVCAPMCVCLCLFVVSSKLQTEMCAFECVQSHSKLQPEIRIYVWFYECASPSTHQHFRMRGRAWCVCLCLRSTRHHNCSLR